MTNKELLSKFYTAFAEGNAQGMVDCYHPNIVFQDPAFGILKGERAVKMWEMLLSQKSAATTIGFDNVRTTNDFGSVDWVAKYVFGPKKRKVVNHVHADFKFKDGKIIEHTDTFDIWKWSSQAMGTIGSLFGWTSFMKNKIQQKTNKQLDRFMEQGK